MAKEKQVTLFVQKNEYNKVKDDMLVHITIYNVPASLVKEFTQEVVRPFYPRGISDAIQDLMRKAILEQEAKQE
jgi:hypothetical protein